MAEQEVSRRTLLQGGAGLLAAGALASPAAALAASGPAAATVTVDVGRTLAVIPASAFGLNAAVWDGLLLDPPLPGLLRRAGVDVIRYPGGSTADVYHWQTNSTEPGQSYANPSNTFDAFMGIVQRAGAQAMLTVNYGSGTPEEAAAWVRYANVTKGYGVKYWEIGNELYGNGTYGADWEFDRHAKGAGVYAQNAVQFIDAMKAVDPTIQVGVVLTAPGNWPDGVVSAYDQMDWNNTVLSIAGGKLNLAIVHWYAQNPGNESDAGLLASTGAIPGMVSALRALIAKWCGANAAHVQIAATETNSVSYNPGKQTVSLVNALFLADDVLRWLEQGVANVDWWDIHNGPVTGTNDSPALYGTAAFGDYGVLSNGGSSGAVSEPPAETPFPPYYGLEMAAGLGRAGDRLVAAGSDRPLVAAHAVQRADGRLAVLLINRDPAASYDVALALPGFTAAPNPHVYFYGEGSTSIATSRRPGMGATRAVTIPPYSLTTVLLSPKHHQRRAGA